MGLPAPTLPALPTDELFQKVAEDYVHFTAFQVMTGEQAGSIPPHAPLPVPGGCMCHKEGAEDERCDTWQGTSLPPPSLGPLRLRAGGCPVEPGTPHDVLVPTQARLSTSTQLGHGWPLADRQPGTLPGCGTGSQLCTRPVQACSAWLRLQPWAVPWP